MRGGEEGGEGKRVEGREQGGRGESSKKVEGREEVGRGWERGYSEHL